ncbi:sensor histidine kinase [Aurantiacibacter gangjinensis]|uniref:histidine kinase n=1 Tax=Aurantiacibacter gangjinensis TaxID=502682 RepID=A0A0G9MMP2_9SPHN|nr:ATP-binding protein [Aurantiacibacter gangjinensis]APE28033.1 putative two-component sensor [Aurantiacibacter gangjinensis]KLE31962.1 hypothetical protein AAW01_11020 [Aurantiacibacter gangjinensis]
MAETPSWKSGHIARLIAAIAMVQALFWFVFVPVFLPPPSQLPPRPAIEAMDYAMVDAPVAEALDAAAFEPMVPGPRLSPDGYHAVRTTFSLDAVPPQGVAVLDQTGADNVRFFMNGVSVYSPGSMDLDDPSYHSYHKEIIHVPAAALREGQNRLTGVYMTTLPREVPYIPPLVGEYDSIAGAVQWKAFTIDEFRLISAVIVAVVALFAGIAASRARERDLPLWLCLAATGWTAYNLFFEWLWFPLDGAARGFYYAATATFVAAAWAIFADAWSGTRLRFYRLGVWIVFALAVLVSGWMMFARYSDTAFGVVETAVEWAGLLLSAATVLRLGWHFIRHPAERRYLEAAVLVLLALLMVFHLSAIILDGMHRPYLAATQPLILLLLGIGFFGRNFSLFRSREQLNAELQDQLDERTAELALAHDREKTLLREQAHADERSRIMRDMHDGVGSTLMSLLMAARRGKTEQPFMEQGLQSAIDEMRLMIDSMDSMGESLKAAFSLFAERAAMRCEGAGFAFESRIENADDLPVLGVRANIQVFRIMQEAVANALKHSTGNRIRLTLTGNTIEIADNGDKLGEARQGGRGLENMQVRAQSIGGDLHVMRRDDETVVQLELPRAAAETVASA